MGLELKNERRHNRIFNDEQYTYKIFNSDYEKKDVFQEAFITSKVELLDAHAPIINSIYQEEDQWCIRFNQIQGESLFCKMEKDPENISKYIEQLVTVQTTIHQKFCTAIPRQKAKLQFGIRNSQLDESYQLDLLEMLDSSPKHKKLCHGNLTPHNIIISEDNYCVLDWNHASQGNASADVARTYIWFKLNMPEYAQIYLDTFCKITGTTKRYVNQWLPIVSAARLYKNYDGEADILKSMIQVIEY